MRAQLKKLSNESRREVTREARSGSTYALPRGISR